MVIGVADCEGSSPRMRGAQVGAILGPKQEGIIPADAGSTNQDEFVDVLWQDHPRGCGEHMG